MKQTARSWRVTVAGLAVGAAGVLGLATPTASADPVFPPRPVPAPVPAPAPQGPITLQEADLKARIAKKDEGVEGILYRTYGGS